MRYPAWALALCVLLCAALVAAAPTVPEVSIKCIWEAYGTDNQPKMQNERNMHMTVLLEQRELLQISPVCTQSGRDPRLDAKSPELSIVARINSPNKRGIIETYARGLGSWMPFGPDWKDSIKPRLIVGELSPSASIQLFVIPRDLLKGGGLRFDAFMPDPVQKLQLVGDPNAGGWGAFAGLAGFIHRRNALSYIWLPAHGEVPLYSQAIVFQHLTGGKLGLQHQLPMTAWYEQLARRPLILADILDEGKKDSLRRAEEAAAPAEETDVTGTIPGYQSKEHWVRYARPMPASPRLAGTSVGSSRGASGLMSSPAQLGSRQMPDPAQIALDQLSISREVPASRKMPGEDDEDESASMVRPVDMKSHEVPRRRAMPNPFDDDDDDDGQMIPGSSKEITNAKRQMP